MPWPVAALLKRPSMTLILCFSGSSGDKVLLSFMSAPEPSALQLFSLMPLPMNMTPKRFGVMFMGNGINENNWSAEGSGADMKLSKTLSPLEPLKHKINVIDGLFNKAATGHGIHPAQTGSLLSGAEIQKGAVIHSG